MDHIGKDEKYTIDNVSIISLHIWIGFTKNIMYNLTEKEGLGRIIDQENYTII